MLDNKKTIIYIGDFDFRNENVQSHLVRNNAKVFETIGYKVFFIGIDRLSSSFDHLDQIKMVNGYFELPFSLNARGLLKTRLICKTIIDQLDAITNNNNVSHVITYQSPTYAIAIKKIAIWCRKKKIEYIVNCADLPIFSSQPFIKKIVMKWNWSKIHKYTFKYANGVIAVSKFIENFYRKANRKSIVLPPLFDEKVPAFAFHKLNPTVSFVYAGTPFVYSKKGVKPKGMKDRLDLIIDWFLELSNMNLNYSLRIIGITKEDYCLAVRRQKEDLLDNLNIEFLGRIDHKNALRMISDSDFSINYRDENKMTKAGFSTKIVESVSLGTPVVTNNSSDISSYLKKDMDWFELNDKTSTNIELIVRLTKLSQEERRFLKKQCLSNAVFSIDKYCEKVKAFLNKHSNE